MYHRPLFTAFITYLLITASVFADELQHTDHHPAMSTDPQLNLRSVVQSTLTHYPQTAVINAMSEEAEALQTRGNAWLSGPPAIAFRYETDQVADNTGFREIENELELPLWKWGQRASGRSLAEQASIQTHAYTQALSLQVTGLVREALWTIKLEDNLHHFAEQSVAVADRLLKTIKRRVELGDLARADVLLVASDRLEKLQALTEAETEMLHSRHDYLTLTHLAGIPENFVETRSERVAIDDNHPALATATAQVQRKQAELQWLTAAGSGQPALTLGGKSERDARGGHTIESFSAALSVPFGGRAHTGPEVAQARLQLTQAMAERDLLLRQLRKTLHEVEHTLAIGQRELSNVNQRRDLAQEHFKMSQKAFEAGELSLIDLLKIQERAQAAERNAIERALFIQRDTARYNQAVGELP